MRLSEIWEIARTHPAGRPFNFDEYTGTDGSRIFRGGTGISMVIDPAGGLWRGRSYEDFDTTYTITESECVIASLTPRYETMHQYRQASTS